MELLYFGIAIIVLYILIGAIYRLYFSPIAKFPGPKLNALTFWVEVYYDIIKRGQYFHEVNKLHEGYGLFLKHCTGVQLRN